MPRALWKDTVIAETEVYETVEGNVYFPRSSLKSEYFASNSHTSRCSWKGLASYYDVVVNGETNKNAAWVYEEPKEAAQKIKGHVAFWKGVRVEMHY